MKHEDCLIPSSKLWGSKMKAIVFLCRSKSSLSSSLQARWARLFKLKHTWASRVPRHARRDISRRTRRIPLWIRINIVHLIYSWLVFSRGSQSACCQGKLAIKCISFCFHESFLSSHFFFIPAKAQASIQGKENRVIVSSPPNISMTNTKQFDNQGQFSKFTKYFFLKYLWQFEGSMIRRNDDHIETISPSIACPQAAWRSIATITATM